MLLPARPLRRSVTTLSPSSSKRGSVCEGNQSSTAHSPAMAAFAPTVENADEEPRPGAAAAPVNPDDAHGGEDHEVGATPPDAVELGFSRGKRAKATPGARKTAELESTAITLDTRRVPTCLLQGKLKPQEVNALRIEAQREYRLRIFQYEVGELYRLERRRREELEDSATGQWDALRAKEAEAAAERGIGGRESQTFLRLQKRMLERQTGGGDDFASREAALREEGRKAWLAEVELKAQRAKDSAALACLRKEEEDQLHRAITFLICWERRDREMLLKELEADGQGLDVAFEQGSAEAVRLVQERFDSSPEQMALREEQEKKAAAARKVAARKERKFNLEQKRLVADCRHAQNGGSLFEGPGAKKVCGRCRVRFDDELGYYVSMDAKSSVGQTADKKASIVSGAGRAKKPSVPNGNLKKAVKLPGGGFSSPIPIKR